ncbi:TPA: AsnC family transcriptional regulator [Candidatus Woesearchaeota archaeon]|nr:AsnC family transcriptional regulator [Candidatus Woesearchaeota archaeon]HII68243.1 AsnC family transcriptional regulator [Candidatus Woesearchaeota archaeon]
MKLEKKDLSLMYQLDANYRRSYAAIGKDIRMSEQLINHKIKRFSAEGIISGFRPLIDYSRFGLYSFIAFFRVSYQSEDAFNELIASVKKEQSVLSLMICDGSYDLAVRFAASNPSSFNKQFKRMLSEFPKLRVRMILTVVVEHQFLRDYLVKKQRPLDVVVGGDRPQLALEAADKAIITALAEGNRKTIELSKAAGISAKTCVVRLKKLEEQGVVKGYRLALHPRKAGISTNLLLARFRNITYEQEEQFTYACKSHPNIVSFIKTFGQWDAVLSVETWSRLEFRKLVLQLREQFDAILDDTDTIRIVDFIWKQSVPDGVLGEEKNGQ